LIVTTPAGLEGVGLPGFAPLALEYPFPLQPQTPRTNTVTAPAVTHLRMFVPLSVAVLFASRIIQPCSLIEFRISQVGPHRLLKYSAGTDAG
jgi:hypothetical protein